MAVNTDPQWYQNMMKSKYGYEPGFGPTVTAPGGPYTFRKEEPEPDGITLRSGSEEMIRCSKQGFWVRGVKVAQDDKEAEAVYNAFKQWLTWATLNDSK